MMKAPTLFLIFLLTTVAGILGYNYFFRPYQTKEFSFFGRPVEVSPTPLPSASPTAQLPSLEAMTHAVLAWPFDITRDKTASSSMLPVLVEKKPVWVTLFGTKVSADEAKRTTAVLRGAAQNPWIWVDHEGGTVQRLSGEGFTQLPTYRELCQMKASESAALLEVSANELVSVGIDGILAPSADLSEGGTQLKSRSCSSDPEITVTRTISWLEIWNQAGIRPVLKHFPGLGHTTKDLHVAFDRTEVSEKQVKVFQNILDTVPYTAVLVSHVGVINQYPDVPCSLSGACIQELSSTYPQSLIVSDALEMSSAGYQASGEELSLTDRAVAALKAGNHVLVFGPGVEIETITEIEKAIVDLAKRDTALATRITNAYQQIETYTQQR